MRSLIYFSCLFAVAFACFLRPGETFDRFLYASTVLQAEGVTNWHQRAFVDAPEFTLQFKKDLKQDWTLTAEQVPMYSNKPLYIVAAKAVTRVLPMQRALAALSALGYVGIGTVVWFWSGRRWSALLLMLLPPFFQLARERTPDALSSFALMGAAWAVSTRKAFPAVLLLMVSQWIRPDNFIPTLALLGLLCYWRALPVRDTLLFAGLTMVTLFALVKLSGSYSWAQILNYNIHRTFNIREVIPHFTLRELAGFYWWSFRLLLLSSELLIWALAASLVWKVRPEWRPLLAAVGVAVVLRLMLHPVAEDRYFGWVFGVIGVAIVSAPKLSKKEHDEGLTTVVADHNSREASVAS